VGVSYVRPPSRERGVVAVGNPATKNRGELARTRYGLESDSMKCVRSEVYVERRWAYAPQAVTPGEERDRSYMLIERRQNLIEVTNARRLMV